MKIKLAIVLMLVGSGVISDSIAENQASPKTYIYRQVDGQALHAYVFVPAHRNAHEQASAIVLVHGGGWSGGEPEWTFDAARRFAALGMVAVAIEYRLSQGNITPIEALADVCSAFRWTRQHEHDLQIDPNRVVGYGISAGGHLVACTATVGCALEEETNIRSQPDAILLWSPALDTSRDSWFHKMLQGRATATAYSPVENVRASTPPTSIVHGAKDTLTPLSGPQLYCERLMKAGGVCELNVYPGVGHLLTRLLENQESNFGPILRLGPLASRSTNAFWSVRVLSNTNRYAAELSAPKNYVY